MIFIRVDKQILQSTFFVLLRFILFHGELQRMDSLFNSLFAYMTQSTYFFTAPVVRGLHRFCKQVSERVACDPLMLTDTKDPVHKVTYFSGLAILKQRFQKLYIAERYGQCLAVSADDLPPFHPTHGTPSQHLIATVQGLGDEIQSHAKEFVSPCEDKL